MTDQPLFFEELLQCSPYHAGQAKQPKQYRGLGLDRLAHATLLQAVRDVTGAEDPEAAWAIAWLQKDGRTWLDELELSIDDQVIEDWIRFEAALRLCRIRLAEQINQTFRQLSQCQAPLAEEE